MNALRLHAHSCSSPMSLMYIPGPGHLPMHVLDIYKLLHAHINEHG